MVTLGHLQRPQVCDACNKAINRMHTVAIVEDAGIIRILHKVCYIAE